MSNDYDEASSGSDDDDDSSSNSNDCSKSKMNEYSSSISKESSGDNDDDDDDDNDDSSVGSNTNADIIKNKKYAFASGAVNDGNDADNYGNNYGDIYGDHGDHDDDDDDDDDACDNTYDDVPLHERLERKERTGLQTKYSRDRKSRALEVANKRLATLKQSRKNTTNNAMTSDDEHGGNNEKDTKRKKGKHKPTEVSSKRADFFRRGAPRLNESGLSVIGAHRYKPLDPRKSTLIGNFDEDNFQHNYAFLEEMRNKEIGQVRKRIAARKATGNKGNRLRRKLQMTHDGTQTLEDDEAKLKYLTETRANLERRKIERAARRSVKRKIHDDVESGSKGVYFLKRKEKKRLELEAKFEEIQKRGGDKAVEKILTKKRQKNKSRDAGRFAR